MKTVNAALKSFVKQLPGVSRFVRYKPMDSCSAFDNLVHAKKLLDELSVRCWLTDGTLLGYYRENQLLGHDTDIDMGCYISEYTDQIIHKFNENGWRFEHMFGCRAEGLELTFSRKGVSLDLFFFYEEDDKYWHGAWRGTDNKENLIKYYYSRFNLVETEFGGNIFDIPENPEKYIITKYGKDWRTPVKEWDWQFGPSNATATDIYMDRD